MLLKNSKTEIGWSAKGFELPSVEGSNKSYDDISMKNGIVIAFICNHCPYVIDIIKRLVNDFSYLKTIDIGTAAIMSNDVKKYPEDSFTNMKFFSDLHGFTFPYLFDEDQKVARLYKAVCTPDFFCFDNRKKLFYRGRLDNLGYKKPNKKRVSELLNACSKRINNNEISKKQHNSMGCSIKWK